MFFVDLLNVLYYGVCVNICCSVFTYATPLLAGVLFLPSFVCLLVIRITEKVMGRFSSSSWNR